MAETNISNLYSVVAPGQRSDQVKALQTALIGAGHNIGAGATGFFGPQTQAAVDAWKKTLGTTTAVETPATPAGPSSFTLDMPNEPKSDVLTKYTSLDEIKKMLEESNTAIDKTLVPTAEENRLKKELADIQAKEDTINQGVKQYKNNLEGEGITSGAIQGRSWETDRNAAFSLEPLALKEKNLLMRLGLEVEARGVEQKIAENKYGTTKDIIEYASKAQAAIDKQKNDLIASTDKMTDNTRQALTTILSQFKGLDFNVLSSEAQLKLQSMANSLGIPIDVIIKGMEVNKNQQDLENLKKTKSSIPTIRSGSMVIQESSVSQGQTVLDSTRGKPYQNDKGETITPPASDRYANTAVYLKMLETWKADGGLEQHFYKNYPPKNYLNPNDPSIPQYIKDMLKKQTEETDVVFE